jgi:hypothetical protein
MRCETNPIEANAKPRFQAENAEMCHRRRAAGDETNPLLGLPICDVRFAIEDAG